MRTPWRACGQCIRRQYLHAQPRSSSRLLSTTNPLRNAANNNNPLRNARAPRDQEVANSQRLMTMSAAGIAACAVAMYGVIELDLFGLKQAEEGKGKEAKPSGAMKMDGPGGFPVDDNATAGHSVIRIKGQDGVDQVETGTSTIPHFPSTIRLPKRLDPESLNPSDEVLPSDLEDEEYQLLGLGIRTVSFLSIQVYVVGLYIATSDISELQQRLVRTALNPPPPPSGDKNGSEAIPNGPGAVSATSLVPAERQQLKQLLLDPERGDAAWDAILKKEGLRTAFRIVPTRNTDFLHLRDGWVRGITGRAQKANAIAGPAGEYQDESFGTALNAFKGLFGGGQRKSVPKGQTLLLLRSARGELDALFQPESTKPARWMGRVSDERISRLVWLNYLAGKNVSSEAARRSVVDGVMGIVERPVGTVVQKVV